ncbi:MAG: hypothetical protein JRL30_09685 [Deltaproteobacteria bacterium]|nr:hypothetical protein [Deltaproteobacteria bacterium]
MIEDFYSRSQSEIVTFSKTTVSFSVSLVERYGLEDLGYARIGVDEELRRIYFAFQKDPAPGLPRFYSQSERSKRKFVAIGELYKKYDWLDDIRKETDKAKRQFILEEVDHNDDAIYPKYKYFITVGYSWSNERDFSKPENYPEEPGVYRLKRSGEIMRIGESNNIARRLKEHLSVYADQVDKFDFEIVPNDEERKQEERRLLKHFKAAVGRLPSLNPIGN